MQRVNSQNLITNAVGEILMLCVFAALLAFYLAVFPYLKCREYMERARTRKAVAGIMPAKKYGGAQYLRHSRKYEISETWS